MVVGASLLAIGGLAIAGTCGRDFRRFRGP